MSTEGISDLKRWKRQLIESVGLSNPDGRPLYAYRLSDTQFQSLEAALKETLSHFDSLDYLPRSLDDVGVVPILVGGCGSVKHWVTLNLANDLGLPWCVFLDSDLGGDPAQVKSIQKRKAEVEAQGKAFYSTRKLEIENYLCPHLIKDESGQDVGYTDTCDAKKIIGNAVGMKPDDVIDRFWPLMSAEKMIERSKYGDGGEEKYELVELSQQIISLVE